MVQFSLSSDPDTFIGPLTDNTVYAGTGQLNPEDRLDGGAGTDTLQLAGSGTFRVDRLATFTGFEIVTLNDFVPVDGNGAANVALFLGSQSNLTVVVNTYPGASTILVGSGTNNTLVTNNATLDLTTSTLSGYSIASAITTGTYFIAGDLATALEVAGGPGFDTLSVPFDFTAAQRHSIFATSSIERIIDNSDAHYTDAASATITSNGGGDTAAVTIPENSNDVTTVMAVKPNADDRLTFSIIGGADADKFVINSGDRIGALSFVTAPNFELPGDTGGNNVYNVIVQASDGHGGVDTQAIAVTVADVGGVTINGTPEDGVIDRMDTADGQPFPTLEGDNFHLGAGNDYFIWNPGDGSDIIDGQAGYDVLEFRGANTGETMDIAAAGNHAHLLHDIDNTTLDLKGVEAIIVNALGGADTIKVGNMTGTDVSEVYVNLAAAGGGGDGQIDKVSVSGTEASDTIQISGTGSNVIITGVSAYVSVLSSEAQDQLTVNGLGGDDHISAASLTSTVSLTIDGGAGNDTIIGNAAANTLISGAGHDYLVGLGGNDILIGGSDPVTLQGGTGDDVYIVQSAGTSITEFAGEGTDTVQTFLSSFTLSANVENLGFVGNASHTGIGNDLANSIQGNTGNDVLIGLGGDDTLIGGAGNDSLVGGAGNDTLIGGLGGNELTGGTGADHFVFKTALDGSDLIHDFSRAEGDKIDVSQLLSSLGPIGADPFTNGVITFQPIGAFGSSGVPATRVMLDIDGSAGPAAPTQLIVALGGTSVIDHTDFIIV